MTTYKESVLRGKKILLGATMLVALVSALIIYITNKDTISENYPDWTYYINLAVFILTLLLSSLVLYEWPSWVSFLFLVGMIATSVGILFVPKEPPASSI